MRAETENFVSEVVNVNDMLVQSIQKRKHEVDVRRSHNTSVMSSNHIITTDGLNSYREKAA